MSILDKRAYKLTKNGYSKKKVNPTLYKIANGYDNYGYISTGLANELNKLYEGNDYEVSIHRTGYTSVTPNFISEVFNNGLLDNGDTMQGVESSYTNERTKFLSPMSNLLTLIGQLKSADHYKNSDGVFVVRIPKSYVSPNGDDVKPIYYYGNGQQRLLPEYIYGYIPVKDGVVGDIVRNPNYKDTHDYKHDGLLYEPEAEPVKKVR